MVVCIGDIKMKVIKNEKRDYLLQGKWATPGIIIYISVCGSFMLGYISSPGMFFPIFAFVFWGLMGYLAENKK